jgi:hypothetical protein
MSNILIYQMGRVGSVAIRNSLKAEGVKATHLHYIMTEGEHPARHLPELKEQILGRKVPFKIIVLVRDPIARNISAFFRTLDNREWTGYNRKLLKKFMTEYNHVWALAWFDLEFNPAFFDIYATYYSPEHSTYKFPPADFIILRTEDLSKKRTADQLTSFLGIEKIQIIKANATEYAPKRAPLYKDFLDNVKLPLHYVEYMYNTPYTTQFYTEKEIERMTKRWTGE